MLRYETTIDMRGCAVEHVEEVIELIRGVGYPTYIAEEYKMHIVLEVGEDLIAPDLWDLRSVCEELEANLSSYLPGPLTIEKPTEMAS